MLRLAITGNLGTGKSTVCRIFEGLGVPVYFADTEAKRLMQHSDDLKKQIQATFGSDTYVQGELQRQKLASIVFQDPQALESLNQLVHPAVNQDMELWFEKQAKKGATIAIEEAALTFEAGHQSSFDKIITVVAPLSLIIKRGMKRDGSSEKEIRSRLNRQMPQMEKAIRSDGIILNDEQHSLIFQVHNIIQRWELEIEL